MVNLCFFVFHLTYKHILYTLCHISTYYIAWQYIPTYIITAFSNPQKYIEAIESVDDSYHFLNVLLMIITNIKY